MHLRFVPEIAGRRSKGKRARLDGLWSWSRFSGSRPRFWSEIGTSQPARVWVLHRLARLNTIVTEETLTSCIQAHYCIRRLGKSSCIPALHLRA